MKDHQLKALLHVAERGSIRAAAKAMHLSQSALTKALRELEDDVGAELLLRSHQGVEFTPAGQALLSCARLVASTLQRAREEIRAIQGGAGARIAVATTPMVVAHALPAIWNELQRTQPNTQLTLAEGLLSSVVPGLIEGSLDFAVAIANPDELPDEVSFEPLSKVYGSPAGRIGHPLGNAREWSDLRHAKWVLNLSAGSQGTSFLRWMTGKGIAPVSNIVQCTTSMPMIELMRRTDLIGFCPQALLDDPLYNTGLQRIEVTPLPPPMRLGLLSLRGVPLGAAAKSLAKLFVSRLKAK